MAKSFLTPIAVLLLAQLPSFANAQAQIEVLDWIVPYPGPKNYTANAGDTITFIWEGDPLPHNVLIHPSMDCTMEDAIYVGATAAGTSYTFAETDGRPDGTDMFFSCDVDGGMGSHCSYGEYCNMDFPRKQSRRRSQDQREDYILRSRQVAHSLFLPFSH